MRLFIIFCFQYDVMQSVLLCFSLRHMRSNCIIMFDHFQQFTLTTFFFDSFLTVRCALVGSPAAIVASKTAEWPGDCGGEGYGACLGIPVGHAICLE